MLETCGASPLPLRLLVLCVLCVAGQAQVTDTFQYRLAAFNPQVFGKTKAGKPEVVHELKKIIRRYDLILFQEIRDASNTAFPGFMADLSENYTYNISIRLGRSNQKEQYAFIYNSERLRSIATYQYPDVNDWFEREPFCVKYNLIDSGSDLSTFGVCGIHVKYNYAVDEIDHLTAVYYEATSQFGTEDIIMMGDFNADCSYVSSSDWEQISLWTNSTFSWLINHTADTTVKSTDCAYDRLVVAGDTLRDAVGPCSNAQPFRFDVAYNLTYDEAVDVSDHYPVEMNVYSEVPVQAQPMVTLYSKQGPTVNITVLTSNTNQLGAFNVSTDTTSILLTKSVGCGDLAADVKTLTDQYPGVLAEVVICEVEWYAGFFIDPYAASQCTVKITYEKSEPNYYSVSLSGIYP